MQNFQRYQRSYCTAKPLGHIVQDGNTSLKNPSVYQGFNNAMERMKPQVTGNENSQCLLLGLSSGKFSLWYFPPVSNGLNPLGICRGHSFKHYDCYPKCLIAFHNPMHVQKQVLHSFQLFENLRVKCYIANLIFSFLVQVKYVTFITVIFMALFSE